MKKENFWKIVAFISVLSFLILLKSRFQFSQDFSDELIKSIVSREFISNLLAVAISGGLSIFILYKQSKHAEKNLEIQIKNQEKQLNQQLELSKTQFEDQQRSSKEQFLIQQDLTVEIIFLDFYLKKLEIINGFLSDLLILSENILDKTDKMMFLQDQLEKCVQDPDFNIRFNQCLPKLNSLQLDFNELAQKINMLKAKIKVYAVLFDQDFSVHISNVISGEGGLTQFEQNFHEVWKINSKQIRESKHFQVVKTIEYNKAYYKLKGAIDEMTLIKIPLEMNNKVQSLKGLY
ncbi:hypothetical protein JavanS624_0014 [Streptococcus satellite phage Javan624]|uniref:hypothetical protein n=1 Tax=Streptococcus uberis TaxID=1349 RepID=UPI00062201E4|nr:hypothetical protein [Streptococcus uberis]KKF60430.1 hypothetical protein AF68_03535 [Streptococcus uberis B362]QBX12006.1 hypothetical protein JavanS624_0014 [Streptococcus satellite phage Javan624]